MWDEQINKWSTYCIINDNWNNGNYDENEVHNSKII